MSHLKTALVLDWPSVDAADGSFLSAWESSVTKELMDAAGFKPDATFVCHPWYVRKWTDLFTEGKPGGPLIDQAIRTRTQLLKDLEEYDIALTMGPHALYTLTGEVKLETYRGTHIDSPVVPGLQVVPTYSPSIFCRLAWNERPVVVSAMRKATSRFIDTPRSIHIPQHPVNLYLFTKEHIRDRIAFDVETCKGGRITEFSLSPRSDICLYIQLERPDFSSVWSYDDELSIMLWLHQLSINPNMEWTFHNATYDLTYLDAAGIRPRGHISDTMLRHHAWQPEWEKSLGFLSALHLPTRAWKHLRTKSKKDYNKAGALD